MAIRRAVWFDWIYAAEGWTPTEALAPLYRAAVADGALATADPARVCWLDTEVVSTLVASVVAAVATAPSVPPDTPRLLEHQLQWLAAHAPSDVRSQYLHRVDHDA